MVFNNMAAVGVCATSSVVTMEMKTLYKTKLVANISFALKDNHPLNVHAIPIRFVYKGYQIAIICTPYIMAITGSTVLAYFNIP